jgi:hypothetical protein
MENFITITQCPDYEISNLGRIRNKKNGRIMKQTINFQGYKVLTLNKKTFYVHKLLGIAFIQNPLNKLWIDHINNNKTDNNLLNLRWVTSSENNQNRSLSKNNLLGIKGVRKVYNNKFVARVKFNNKVYYLGTFKTLAEAKKARLEKVNELFGIYTHNTEKIKTEPELLNELEIEFINL